MEGLRVGFLPGPGDLELLRRVERKLAAEAAAKPGTYLAGYEGMKAVMGVNPAIETVNAREQEILAAERAIMLLLPPVEGRPGAPTPAADGGLGRLYFQFLK
jgi:hypothetical protein